MCLVEILKFARSSLFVFNADHVFFYTKEYEIPNKTVASHTLVLNLS